MHLAHNRFTLVSYMLFYILLNLFRTASKVIHDDVALIDLVLRISVRQLWSQMTVLHCLREIFKLSIFQPWTAHFNHSELLAGLVNDRGVDSISF